MALRTIITTWDTDAQDVVIALDEFLTVMLGLEYGTKFSL